MEEKRVNFSFRIFWLVSLADLVLLPYCRAGQEFASIEDAEVKDMKPRICICCGEEISERGNTLSRNPNLCASCSSLADGMDLSDHSTLLEEKLPPTNQDLTPSPPPEESPALEVFRVSQNR